MKIVIFLILGFLSNQVLAECGDFSLVKNRDDLKTKIKALINNQSYGLKGTDSRHVIGDKLNKCIPTKDSTGLVIKFSGTGAFNPRANALMADLIKCQSFQGLPKSLKLSSYSLILSILKENNSHFTKWSTIEKGMMSELIINPELNQIGKNLNYANFASEESELLADIEYMNLKNLKNILHEINLSINNLPIGIQNALICTLQYFNQSKSLNINPKLIILSHSSGARTAVKYLEKLKIFKPELIAELVVTIDPVKEAQGALAEVFEQYIGNISRALGDWIPAIDLDQKPVNVWSRHQPKSLYKTSNSKRWINFYQASDIEGIKLGVKFGIFGSPIYRADHNYFIQDGLGASAHGQIGYHKEVLSIIREEFISLLAL